MIKRMQLAAFCVIAFVATGWMGSSHVEAAEPGQPANWQRFYYYPYVYYPQNFQQPQQYDSLYHKYPVERQIPVYNKDWHNFYPSERPYHSGFHFILDTI